MSATLHDFDWTKDQSHRNRHLVTPIQLQARAAFWWGVICFFLGLTVGLLSGVR